MPWSLLRKLAPYLIVAALLLVLAWRYSDALEQLGRLESERRELLATNQANVAAMERLSGELARRDQLRREIADDLRSAASERDALKSRLEQVNADAPQEFRDCLAVPLPREHIRLQLDPDEN